MIQSAARLFRALGYTYARTFWTMRIELGEQLATPVVPAGIDIRTFDRERDERGVYRALAEAFDDHWGRGFPTYEQWLHHDLDGESPEFDPGLWFIALEGDEVAGAACCRASIPRAPDTGEVSTLGVRRAWRERGIARALLLTGFAELRRRGIPRAELGVDSESPTGATRVYERAGMHVAYSSEQWEKELRAVSEPTGM